MTLGFVSPAGRPLVHLAVLDGAGNEVAVEVWIDTGFDGELLLPNAMIEKLNLKPNFAISVRSADGSEVEKMTYMANVIWGETSREIQIVAADNYPLMGLSLLREHQLNITFTDGGTVSIEPLN
jgi:clan AA aspartic protease